MFNLFIVLKNHISLCTYGVRFKENLFHFENLPLIFLNLLIDPLKCFNFIAEISFDSKILVCNFKSSRICILLFNITCTLKGRGVIIATRNFIFFTKSLTLKVIII